MQLTEKQINKFWSKVTRPIGEGCWLWNGYRNPLGYGQIRFGGKGKLLMAHRLSWELSNGNIDSGKSACHKCDNPSCVNPTHIFIGTHKENMEDCARKGRMHRGEKNGSAKLNREQILEIRKRYIRGETQWKRGNAFELAKEFGVSVWYISRIAKAEKFWSWLPKSTESVFVQNAFC